MALMPNVLAFNQVSLKDLEIVGGKNASLGEMIQHLSKAGVKVPGGFATTAHAFKDFIAQNGLGQEIYQKLATLDVDDVKALAKVGAEVRQAILDTPFKPSFVEEVRAAYAEMEKTVGRQNTDTALKKISASRQVGLFYSVFETLIIIQCY